MDKESCNWYRFATLLIDIGSEVLRTYFSLEIQTSCFGRFSRLWLNNVLNSTAINYASTLWTKLFLSLNSADKKTFIDIFGSWNENGLPLLEQIHKMKRRITDIQSQIKHYPDTDITIMKSLVSKIQHEISDLNASYNILKDWTGRLFEIVNKYQQGLQGKIKKYHDDFILSCQKNMRRLKSPSKHHIENFVIASQNDVQSMRHNWIQDSEEYINFWMSEIHSILDSFKNEERDIRYNYVLQDLLNGFTNGLLNAQNSCMNDIQQIGRSWNDDLQMMFGKWQLQINGFAKLGWNFERLIPLWCMDLRAHHSSADYQIREFFRSQDVQTNLKHLKEQGICKDPLLSNLSVMHDFPDLRRFDITNLHFLLRNMCHVCPPYLGWFGETPESDLSVGADLMRLRSSRNDYIGHIAKASIPENTFGELWQTVEELLCRLASHCSDCFQDKIRKKIADLKIIPLEPQQVLVLKENRINWCKDAILVDISDMSLSGAVTEETFDRFMEMYRSVQNTEENVFQKNPDFVTLDAQGKASVAGTSRHIMVERVPKRSPQQPGKVSSSQTTATSAYLVWEKPKGPDEVSYYEVKYRSCGEDRWRSVDTKHPTESHELRNLKSETNYEFKVRAIFSDGNEGPFSEVSDPVTTLELLATRLKKLASKVGSGNPQIYKIPLTFSEETTNKRAMIRKGRLGERDQLRPAKTIMLLGATGAGKSTLIDAMINYIVDVSVEDDFRFTMIDLTEDEKATVCQKASWQTNWITCYEVNYQSGSRLNYTLNIIDTPGFGDTRGIQHDEQIVDQIREFLTAPGDRGIDSIDAICFVTQAHLARLTLTQHYIFDSILSVFGKDVKDNIFVLVTFADGKQPPVVASLQEVNVPFQKDKTFTFNNSALFESIESSNQFTQMFWKFGMKSFDNFFDKLHYVQQRNFRLTSEVLALRKQIENTIERLQLQIQDGLHTMDTVRKETEVLERHTRDIESNRNFTYVSDEIHQRVVPTQPGQYVTNCFVCNFTCHLQCKCADNKDKANCSAMGKDGYCTECNGKCHWKKHRSDSFYYETYIKKVEGTYEQMKSKYESAITGQKEKMSLIESIKSAVKSKGQQVLLLMNTVRESINELEKYALKPNPLSEVNYVTLLIDSEKRELKPGFEARLQVLEEIKKKAELVQKISNKTKEWTDEDVESLFKNF